MLTAGRKIDDLVPVAQRALERDNALSAYAQELCCPEGAPLHVVCGIRCARIEANLIEAPPSRGTDCRYRRKEDEGRPHNDPHDTRNSTSGGPGNARLINEARVRR
jgi:hypothetical protein